MTDQVRLIGITQPTISDNAQDLMAYCARVSNPDNQDNHATAGKLLSYCIQHKHWSVFEMASMIVEINTTRDIARQILRHRSFHFQEHSQRYSEYIGFGSKECRLQDSKNRQNSIDYNVPSSATEFWDNAQQVIKETAHSLYQRAIDRGIAKEVARSILPEGLTKSRMYMHGTIRDFYHYCELRTGPETQKEHRVIAKGIQDILYQHFPALRS